MRNLIQGTVLLAVIVLVACEEAAAPPSYELPPEPPPQEEPDPEPPPGWSKYESCEEAFRDPNVCGGCIVNEDGTGFAPNCVAEPVLDSRCPYGFRIPLLDQVSDVGTLCATANYEVSRVSLNRVSRMSHAMLKRNSALVSRMAPVLYENRIGGFFILLYAGQFWCDDGLPDVYASRLSCGRVSFGGGGMFARPIILCPESDLAICVHEIAHAVYFALSYLDDDPDVNNQDPIVERFAGLDIEDLWSGYATTDVEEFFAEMTAIYFCSNAGATFPAINCAHELREYDPATYEVVHAIYRGSADLR